MLGTRFQKKYGNQGHMDSLLPMATANIEEKVFRVRLPGLVANLGNLHEEHRERYPKILLYLLPEVEKQVTGNSVQQETIIPRGNGQPSLRLFPHSCCPLIAHSCPFLHELAFSVS